MRPRRGGTSSSNLLTMRETRKFHLHIILCSREIEQKKPKDSRGWLGNFGFAGVVWLNHLISFVLTQREITSQNKGYSLPRERYYRDRAAGNFLSVQFLS